MSHPEANKQTGHLEPKDDTNSVTRHRQFLILIKELAPKKAQGPGAGSICSFEKYEDVKKG